MEYTDICLITENVAALRDFYTNIFQVKADGDDTHTSLSLSGTVLGIYDKAAAKQDMLFDFSEFDGTGRLTIGFNVANVDLEYQRLQKLNVDFITTPKTYPWGARSVHFRDPDGNIICFRSWIDQ